MRFLTKLWLAQFSILMLVVAIFAGSSILVMDRIILDNHARILAGRLEAIERELDALTLEAGIGRAVVRDVLRRHTAGSANALIHAFAFAPDGTRIYPPADASRTQLENAPAMKPEAAHGIGWLPAGDSRILAGHTTLANTGIVVGVGESTSAVYAWHRLYIAGISTAAFAVLLGGSVAAWIFGRRVSRRVAETQSALESIRQGEFGVRIDTAGAGDEIASIQSRINEMADSFARRARERELATRWLEESEERFRDFAESTSDALWETDADLRYTLFVNPGTDFASVMEGEGVIGKRRGEYFRTFAIDDPNWKKHLEDLDNRRPFRAFAFSGVYPDGTVFHRASSGVPKFDGEGRFIGYRGTTKDITDLVEAERSLEGLVGNIPGLLFQRLIHPDDSIEYVYVKGNASAVFGDVPPEEMARMAASLERIHPDDREMFRRMIIDGARSREPHTFEFRQLLPNGDFVWKRSICSATTVRPDGALVQHGVSFDISDIKTAENELRVARDRLLDFAATGSDTLWETDADHRLIWLSDPSVPERRHYPREKLLGTRRWEFPGAEPADSPAWAQHLDDLANRRPFRDFEFSSAGEDGRTLHRRVSGRPLFDEDGGFIGYRGTSTDITERVEAEQAAREHQKRLLDAIQSSDQGVALFDADDRLVFVNDTWRELQPHVPGMVDIGASFEEIVIAAGLKGLLDNARPDPQDWARRRIAYHRNPEGNFATVPIDGRMIEVRDERLPDGGSIVHLADVTSEFEFQEALLASEERFRGFAESGSDWIWETDEEHRIVWLSASVSAHSDYRIEDMLGRTRWEIFGIDLAQDRHWRALKEDMDAHRRIRDFRWSRVAKSGRVLHRVMNGTPFYDSAGRFRGYRGAVTDSTALVEAENRAQQAERRFVEAINTINEALFLFDPEDRAVFANRRARQLFGIDDEDDGGVRLEGMSFGEILRGYLQRGLVPISRGEEAGWLAARMEHHRNPEKSSPFVIRRSDGIVLEVREELLPDGSVMMFQNDISARVEAERARQDSEQRFRDFAEASSDWLWETDADFRFTWVSEGVAHGDRMKSSDFVGRTRWDVFGADIESDERWRSHIEDLLARRPFRDVRLSRVGEHGQRLYRSVSGVPYYDPLDGSFLGYRGTTSDITAQVEAEQRYRNLIEQSPTPVLVHHGEILAYANPAAIEMFGARSEADLIGRSITELVHPDDLPEFQRRLSRIVDDGVVTDLIQQRRLRLDGSEIVVISRGVPVIWEGRRAVLGALIDVTDRVKAERQYRELIENAPMAISVDDGERFIFVNQAFADLFGASSPEEIVGRPIVDMADPDDLEAFQARVQAVAEHRETLETAQLRRRRFDGAPIFVLTRGVPIQWEGKPATLGIQVDITDRIEAQEALRDSEERFRNLVEGSRQGVLLHVDFKPVFANAALAEMFGFDSVDEVLGLPSILDLVAAEHRELWRQNREARLGGLRVPESYEFMGLKKDGSPIWVHITVRVVGWQGRTALQGTMIDITDRRRAEDLIRESEERFRTLTSLSPVGFFVADQAGNCEYVNEAYEAMSGRSLEDCVGRGWVNGIHPDERDRVFEEWYAATRLGRHFRTEFRFLRPDGEITWGIAQAAAQRDSGGNIGNFVGAVTDVTGRKRMEKALEDSEERFRMLTSLSPVGVFLTDRRGDLIYVNEALAQMLGMPGEEALGRNWASGSPGRPRRPAIAMAQGLRSASGHPRRDPHRRRWRAKPVGADTGKPAALAGWRGHRLHRRRHRRDRAPQRGGTAPPGAEDGCGRPAYGRDRARLQQPARHRPGQPRAAARTRARGAPPPQPDRGGAQRSPARRQSQPAPSRLRPPPAAAPRRLRHQRDRLRYGRPLHPHARRQHRAPDPFRRASLAHGHRPERPRDRGAQPRDQRPRRHAGERLARDQHGECAFRRPEAFTRAGNFRWGLCGRPRYGYRNGYGPGNALQGVRTFLHDEGHGQGQRPRPLDGLRLRPAIRRPRDHRKRAWPRHVHLPLLPAR